VAVRAKFLQQVCEYVGDQSASHSREGSEAPPLIQLSLPAPCPRICETVEHPFGTLKMRMGATHFLMKRLPKVATEMALHVLAYNLTRAMNIMGIQPLMAAIRA
jgi:hypothetical protein